MKNVKILSLNGLMGAEGCHNTITIPLVGTSLQIVEEKEIPSCLWSMRNLTTLHLAGNGYVGEVKLSALGSGLNDVTLSHNRFSGTIPNLIQTMKRIDLSHNRFVGHLNVVTNTSTNDTMLHAQVNRLSGRLPIHSLEGVESVDILRGNKFSCHTIPQNDINSRGYICGKKCFNFFCSL